MTTSPVATDVQKVEVAFLAAAPKLGIKTSELGLSVAVLVGDGLETYGHVPHALALTTAQTALTAVYVLARTFLKAQHVKAVKR